MMEPSPLQKGGLKGVRFKFRRDADSGRVDHPVPAAKGGVTMIERIRTWLDRVASSAAKPDGPMIEKDLSAPKGAAVNSRRREPPVSRPLQTLSPARGDRIAAGILVEPLAQLRRRSTAAWCCWSGAPPVWTLKSGSPANEADPLCRPTTHGGPTLPCRHYHHR